MSSTSLAIVPLLGVCLLAGSEGAMGQSATVASDAAPASSWNQWRGPERTGRFLGRAWPARLTDDNFRRLWRVELGPSYSGPIVDAKRVFTTETVDKTHEVVRALDRATGKPLWQKKWKGAMSVPFFARKNGSWIRSTPAHDGESIYVAGMRDVLYCLDIETGEERWKVDFMQRYESPLPQFGFVCSPLVHGDHVYVQAGASFVKLDKRTGESVWRSLQDGGGMLGSAFSSPVFATVQGVQQLLVQTRANLCGVDAETGKALWEVPVRTFRGMNILTPTLYGSSVFTSAYGGRAHLFSVEKGAGGFAVSEKWQNRAQGYMTSPVVIDRHAYLYLRSKRFSCVNLDTGEVAWISEPMGDEYWSLVAHEDRILALSNTGELRLIRANPEKLEVIDRLEVAKSATWAHLAVDGNQVLIRELDALSAFRWAPRARVASTREDR